MNTKNTILLIIRLFLGVLILTKAYGKFTGMEGTIAFFSSLGLSATIAWIVAIGETLVGVALILGAWVRVAALGLLVITAGVFYYAGHYNWQTISLFAGSIILLVTGGGLYAVCRSKELSPSSTATPSSSMPPSSTPSAPQA